MPFHIGLLLFPNITQLDLTGPYEVFTKLPDTKVHLVWKNREPVTADGGMQICRPPRSRSARRLI
jgi:cyclohexyl-isocyanide hydratase